MTKTLHKTLEERLITFYGKSIEEIPKIEDQEFDWGKAEAKELW